MVSAVHFYATANDHEQLLDYLGEPAEVTLHPWPVVASPPIVLSREEALSGGNVMVVRRALGLPVLVRDGDAAMSSTSKAGLFNRLNWERLKPQPTEALVDSNASPVLLWAPATHTGSALTSGHIGSQADSLSAVSSEYERWAKAAMNWVRRRGTKVWGLEAQAVRPDLDVRRPDVTTVFALPDALAVLEGGGTGT
ncbi:hypothetical protein GCM10009623_00940 [Nocardioides aestuarii]|uniref:Uncharacterized protein n=1 Tax=Nocardioides aestuarii TaxID=252231 RepID=A0ABW4TH43_9ACTN